MKNRKTRIIMGIMVGLVLFSSSVALLLYLKKDKLKENTQANIEVFVAAKKINKGDIIDAKSLKKAKLPKSYIKFTPLTDAEIIGRYAKVDIYTNEPIRLEKISVSKPVMKKVIQQQVTSQKISQKPIAVKKVQQLQKDALSVPVSLFKNKDTTLQAGDFIDIACAVATTNTKRTNAFQTKYIALHVKINSFVHNGTMCTKPVTYNEKKQAIKADTLILQMSPREIKNFLALYYKTQALNNNRVYNTNSYGGQLWLIKTPKEIDEKMQREKERLLVDRRVSTKQRKKRVQRAKISYEN